MPNKKMYFVADSDTQKLDSGITKSLKKVENYVEKIYSDRVHANVAFNVWRDVVVVALAALGHTAGQKEAAYLAQHANRYVQDRVDKVFKQHVPFGSKGLFRRKVYSRGGGWRVPGGRAMLEDLLRHNERMKIHAKQVKVNYDRDKKLLSAMKKAGVAYVEDLN